LPNGTYDVLLVPKDAAPVNGGERSMTAPLFLTGWHLLEALDLIAPDRANDPDQMDEEIALQMGDETCHSGAGLYAWDSEYPEDGSSFLEGKRDDCHNGSALDQLTVSDHLIAPIPKF